MIAVLPLIDWNRKLKCGSSLPSDKHFWHVSIRQ